MAVATGGLKMTRTATKTMRSSDESTEQVILVYSRGGPVALIPERELGFSCLGSGMSPSSTANMGEVARRLRTKAPSAFYDERLLLNVILFGATGMVGQGALRECLEAPDVARGLAVGRDATGQTTRPAEVIRGGSGRGGCHRPRSR
jgi:hypothetical protein